MYKSIQICRAISALLVVLFHLGGNVALDRYFGAKAFDGPFAFGDAGVAFFFVISGFVITSAHWNDFGNPQALFPYLKRRAIRIYPTYWIVFSIVLLLAYQVPSIRANMPSGTIPILKEAFLLPRDTIVTGGTGTSVLIVAWSLQYEVFFYLLTAILIINPTIWIVMILTLGAAFIAVRTGMPNPFPLSFLTSEHIPLFGFGMLAAYLVRKRVPRPAAASLAVAGIAAFASLAIIEVLVAKLPSREILYGLAAVITLFGLVRLETLAITPWAFPKWELIGDASYILYLIHFPVISVICKAVLSAGLRGAAGAAAAAALSLLVSIGGAILLHVWMEKPILRILRTRRKTSISAKSTV